MTYMTTMVMAVSNSLIQRIAACVAEDLTFRDDPMTWAHQNAVRIVAAGGQPWQDAWEYAENTKSVNDNPDTGIRTDVISDEMIEAAVHAVRPPG